MLGILSTILGSLTVGVVCTRLVFKLCIGYLCVKCGDDTFGFALCIDCYHEEEPKRAHQRG